MKRIVVVAADPSVQGAIRACYAGYQVDRATDLRAALALRAEGRCEVVFLDLALLANGAPLGQLECRRALRPLWEVFPAAQLVVMASPARMRDAVEAVRSGAASYLTYPISPVELELVREVLRATARAGAEPDPLGDPFWRPESRGLLRTASPAMTAVFAKVRQVAQTRSTVLLTGETGTGKNLVAKLIHTHSNRQDRQFVGVHCGAIPETLVESELFGHERGAFTGAVRRKLGKFEIADRGTIFLDEIGTIGPSMQVKLLQVLQERTIQRVGGEQPVEVDIRILAATNSDLRLAAEEGGFRKDLFYRLNVFPIELPPLRERREDVPLLVEGFFERLNRLYGKGIVEVHPLVMDAFRSYAWPGNVRELESLMERAYILEPSQVLGPESFPRELFVHAEAVAPAPVDTSGSLAAARSRAVADVERLYLREQLARNQGRVNATARAAGISERQLQKLMGRHGLRKEDFRPPSRRRRARSPS